jgi:predicted esterase
MARRRATDMHRELALCQPGARFLPVADGDMPHQQGQIGRYSLRLRVGEAVVPAILLLPPDAERQVPAALLLHGYSSRKERMADTIGRALAIRGVASLAIDLPLHGDGDAPLQREALRNPLALVVRWRLALAECAAALDCLADHERYDSSRLGLVGYSLGAYVGVAAAARDTRVRALVLAAGGDLPLGTPFERLVRAFADPRKAVRRLAGRPLLMTHGRLDRTVRPADAHRLFSVAGDPKEMRWWNAGHMLPAEAIEDAASWLAHQLRAPMSARRSG